ncbi:MAG: DNA mismatch endonuclease Vsr [Clostridia bacterium]|nr:DNA mismatch endonuclease Vsr [Clostridia bacterium]
MDNRTKEARSENMSHIHSKNTKPEEKVCKYLFKKGFRYRKNVSKLPGKPDIVLPKYKSVIFVNGCFWHRHENCKYASMPKSNVEFWAGKFEYNVMNDKKHREQLERLGWNVIVIWECEVKKDFEEHMAHVIHMLRSSVGGA